MLRHHFHMILRGIVRSKSTFIINLIGLSTGLAAALLIYLWSYDELQIDKFHNNSDRLFQVMHRTESGGEIQVGIELPPVVASALKEEMPEVEMAVTEGLTPMTSSLSVNEKSIKASGAYVDPGYFEIFSYGLNERNTPGILTNDNNIVISKDLASRIFGRSTDVVGRTVTFDSKEELMVSGVFDIPATSSQHFDFAIPFKKAFIHAPNFKNGWNNSWPSTYLLLKPGTDVVAFNNKIEQFYSKHSGESNQSIFITSYPDRYLHGNYENGINAGGRIQYVKLFLLIAVFILIIACINFANLATAKASQRLKEVGIKKSFGVSRRSLTNQYMLESVVIASISLMIAIALDIVLMPQFNLLTGKNLSLHASADIIWGSLGITIITALLAGSYPALYLSGFSPAVVLKGKMNPEIGTTWIRRGLVVVQFTVSIVFMIAVLVVYKQMNLIQTRNLGYDRNNVIYFEMDSEIKDHKESFLDGVRNLPGVEFASDIWWGFLGQRNSTSDMKWTGKDPGDQISMQYRRIDEDLIETLGVNVKQGKSFKRDIPASHSGIIFNESAIVAMGLNDPVGKTVELWGKPYEIIGVTEDFHFESLYENVQPLFFIYNPERANTIMIRFDASQADVAMTNLKSYYDEFTHHAAIDIHFLNDDFQAQYAAENRVEVLSKYFSGIAIVLSCLGLLGLAAYTAERRVKKVGIRKILGASERGIIYLLTKDFTKTVMIAIALALPIGYMITRNWLDHFTIKAELHWWYFVGVAIAAIFISWITVGLQAFRAARINPVTGLRSE